MFEYIKGKIAAVQENYLVLENGGIGYKIFSSIPTMEKLRHTGTEVTVYTYLYIRDDVLDLYGFASIEDINCFKMLISVSGVGPKAALSILSELTSEQFALSVVTENTKEITKANGVGPKLAKRIILELKDKIKNDDFMMTSEDEGGAFMAASDAKSEAINALLVLGYTRQEAISTLKTIDTADMTLEDMIKAALKKMMK